MTEKVQDHDEVSQHRKINVKDANLKFEEIHQPTIVLETNTTKSKISIKNTNMKAFKTGLKNTINETYDRTDRDSISISVKPCDNSVFREIKESF